MSPIPPGPARPVLVSGATGNVGAALLSTLHDAGHAAIAASPHALERAPSGVLVRRLDFEDPSTFAPALDGVGAVFLMRPPHISDVKTHIRPFIAAMKDAKVEHVVFLSLMGVNPAMPHWQVEQDLRASNLGWTFLRAAFFSQNLGVAYQADIRDHDRLRLASGRGRTSFIDARDIADVAAIVLTAPAPHLQQAYTLTGPQALDYYHVASMLSAILGRPIVYEPIGLLTYRAELLRQNLPPTYVNVQLLINLVARLGLAARVDPTLERLLGRPPRSLQEYLVDHAALWQLR